MKIFSIKDLVADEFGPVSNHTNRGTILRELSGVVNDTQNKTLLAKNPKDYELYQVGEFDAETGRIDSKLEFVCNLGDLVNESSEK